MPSARSALSASSALRSSVLILASAFALATPIVSNAAESIATSASSQAPRKELTEKLTAELGNLRSLTEAKKYTEALRLIDTLSATSPAESFDTTVLLQIKIQVELTVNNLASAASSLEQLLAQGPRNGFIDQKSALEQNFLLARVCFQQAAEAKTPSERAPFFARAATTLDRWFLQAPQPTAEARLFAADLYYAYATNDPTAVDLARVRRALSEAQQSITLQIKPSPRAYVLILASLQQLGERQAVADYLELLVAREPTNTGYWQQLNATYLALASEAVNDEVARNNYNLRALLAIERAQAAGQLRGSQENLNLVSLYFTLGRVDRAIALLQSGLDSGSIASTRRNWEFLASAYQQAHRVPEAIVALEKASAAFPKDGQIDFAVAQILYSEGRLTDALPRLEIAVSKGRLDKPGQAHLFLGYVAYELHRYDDVVRWTDDAARFDDVKKEDLTRLSRAAKVALQERALTAQPATSSKSSPTAKL